MNEDEQREQDRPEDEILSQEEDEVSLLKAQLEEERREAGQFRELLQRVQADSINYRRRVEEEKGELQQRANADLVLRLLPILDDYERAIQHVPDVEELRPWTAGMELVYRNFKSLLESFGVTQIQALGMSFDPVEHEALLHQPSEGNEEGKVVAVVRKGYKLHGRVLRPVQVAVSKRKDNEPAEGESLDSHGKESN